MLIGLLENTDTERQSIFWEQFLLQEFPLFFVGLWPYCADWPISVTGKATATDTTGSHINSKEMLDIYDVKGTTSKVILYLHLKHLNNL